MDVRFIAAPRHGPFLFPTHAASVAEAVAYFRRPPMPDADVDIALFPDCNTAPITFGTTRALARHIHRQRGDSGLELHEGDTLKVQSEQAELPVVSIYLQDDTGGRTKFLGHAWLRRGGRRALEGALRAQRRDRPAHRHAVVG